MAREKVFIEVVSPAGWYGKTDPTVKINSLGHVPQEIPLSCFSEPLKKEITKERNKFFCQMEITGSRLEDLRLTSLNE